MKTHTKLGLAAAGMFAFAAVGPASAQSAGDIATGLATQMGAFATLATIVSFVLGVALAIMGLMKFKANSDNPNDPSNKKSTAFVLVFVGAGLVAIPTVLGSGITTIFGDGAATTDATTGFQGL